MVRLNKTNKTMCATIFFLKWRFSALILYPPSYILFTIFSQLYSYWCNSFAFRYKIRESGSKINKDIYIKKTVQVYLFQITIKIYIKKNRLILNSKNVK